MAVTPVAEDGEDLVATPTRDEPAAQDEVMSMPPTMGSSCSPALVGVAPCTVWR